jgi:hypothetical protein
MDIKIWKPVMQALGEAFMMEYGIDRNTFRWEEKATITLMNYSPFKLVQLKNALKEFPKLKGVPVALREIDVWLKMQTNPEDVAVKNAKHLHEALKKFMLEVPGQRMYRKDEASGTWYAYYIHKLSYQAPQRSRDWYQPGRCRLYGVANSFGKRTEHTSGWTDERCEGNGVAFMLSKDGWYPESEELRANYMTTMARYEAWYDQIGKQFWAIGEGTDDLDGNPEKDNDRDYWWRKRTNKILLEKNGEPSRVVIDLFREGDEEQKKSSWGWDEERSDVTVDPLWWEKIKKQYVPDEEGDIETSKEVIDDVVGAEAPPVCEIPVHPMLAVFDLKRHLRLRVHCDQLTEYEYNPELGKRLILPQQDRDLVDILLAHKSTFADVVSGKGGGSVILCTGKPGLGKTLTSEIYAEVAKRPLYTIQCSQLGTDPDEIEDNLIKIFYRSERWGTILQLDEADVYIRTRGDDLVQNAIVGVFLRTMEYYRGVMFMTTNRPDLVDDAIASRCVARIDYKMPTKEAQEAMWLLQASINKATLTAPTAKAIVKEFPDCSGRDIKNMVKLSLLYSEAKGHSEITLATVKFVKRFKPTGEND